MTARQDVRDNEAVVSVTYMGNLGDLPTPVPLNATDAEILNWVTESVRSGSVVGLGRHENADFRSFVIQRFPPTDDRSYAIFMLRPKTTFGF